MPTLKPFQVPVDAKYGAPMGRQESPVEDFTGPVYLQKVPMVDGDYDEGGAYWGGGTPLYCAWDEKGMQSTVRAKDSSAAKKKLPAHWEYAGKAAQVQELPVRRGDAPAIHGDGLVVLDRR